MQLVDAKTCPDLDVLSRPLQMPDRQHRKLDVRCVRSLDGLWRLMTFPQGSPRRRLVTDLFIR